MLQCKGGSEEKILWRSRQQSTSYAATLLRKLGELMMITHYFQRPYFNLMNFRWCACTRTCPPQTPWWRTSALSPAVMIVLIFVRWVWLVHHICNRLLEHILSTLFAKDYLSIFCSPYLQQTDWAYPLQDPSYRSKDWVPLGLGWIRMMTLADVACCENCPSILVF